MTKSEVTKSEVTKWIIISALLIIIIKLTELEEIVTLLYYVLRKLWRIP